MLLKKLKQKNYYLIKSCLLQFYLNKDLLQLLHLVFMFAAAANLVMDEFEFSCQSCQSDKFNGQSSLA